MRVVITGAGGFLGQELLKQLLLESNNTVYALTSQPLKLKKYDNKSGIIICSKEELFENKISDIDVLINCAFPRNTNGNQLEEGLEYTMKVLQSAQRLNVRAVINISSQSLYDQNRKKPATELSPIVLNSIYATGKYAVELLVRAICSNTVYTNIRLASLIGPEFDQRVTNKLVDKAIESGRISIKAGKQYFGFLDVEDAANGILRLLRTPFERWKSLYNLGGNNACTLEEIANNISHVMKKYYGKEIQIEAINDDAELNTSLDSSLIMKDTGYRPQISLVDSIFRIVQTKL